MARSKQTKSSDGKHRKETKEERRIRLEKQEDARQACLRLLPVAGGLLVAAMIAFAFYVRSVPPKQVINLTSATPNKPKFDPEFMQAMKRPIPVAKDTPPVVKEADNTETIEL